MEINNKVYRDVKGYLSDKEVYINARVTFILFRFKRFSVFSVKLWIKLRMLSLKTQTESLVWNAVRFLKR